MLTAVIHVGDPADIGEGFDPAVVAHLHGGGLPRFVAYEVRPDGGLERVPGAYAPDPDEEPPNPITDLLVALCPEGSVAGQRLRVLSTKAEANAGVSLRERVFSSDTARETPGYGRHFEARSQLEAHPYEAVVAVGLLPGVDDRMRAAIEANLERLDAPTRRFEAVT